MVELICCVCIAAIAAADQLIKIAVLNSPLVSGEVSTVIDGFLQWRYVEKSKFTQGRNHSLHKWIQRY